MKLVGIQISTHRIQKLLEDAQSTLLEGVSSRYSPKNLVELVVVFWRGSRNCINVKKMSFLQSLLLFIPQY